MLAHLLFALAKDIATFISFIFHALCRSLSITAIATFYRHVLNLFLSKFKISEYYN
jgi:hypothetical protein